MPRSRSALGERLHLGGQHLAHAEGRHERTRERGIRRQVGDVLVEHARLEPAGDVADQARADHRAVGLVHEGAERTGGFVRGIRPPRQLPRGRRRASRAPHGARPSRASAPDHSTSSTVDPSALTHCASTSSGISARSRPGPSLMPAGMRARQVEHPVERRRLVLGPHAGGLAVARRAPRGIEPHRVDAATDRMLSAEPWRTVTASPNGARLYAAIAAVTSSASTASTRRPSAGESQRVAADAAAEVGDASSGRRRGTAPA